MAAGLKLVLPTITALLVVNIAFGVMTRAAPQLNIFYRFPADAGDGFCHPVDQPADILNQYQPLATEALQGFRDMVRAR